MCFSIVCTWLSTIFMMVLISFLLLPSMILSISTISCSILERASTIFGFMSLLYKLRSCVISSFDEAAKHNPAVINTKSKYIKIFFIIFSLFYSHCSGRIISINTSDISKSSLLSLSNCGVYFFIKVSLSMSLIFPFLIKTSAVSFTKLLKS